MPKATFFPIGNADTCLIELSNGRRVLFDFADMRNADDQYDLRCDLEKELRDRMGDDDDDVFGTAEGQKFAAFAANDDSRG